MSNDDCWPLDRRRDILCLLSVYAGLDYNRQCLTAPADELLSAARTLGEILKDEGMIDSVLNLEAVFSADYLPEEVR